MWERRGMECNPPPHVWWQLLRCCVKSSKPDKASFPVRWGSEGDVSQPRTIQLIPLLVCWQLNLLSEFQNVLLCAELKGLNMIFFNVLWFVYIALYILLYSTVMKVRTTRQHITWDIILLTLVEVEAGAELPAFHRKEQSFVRIFIFIILSVCRKVLKRGFKFNVFLNLVPDSYRY